ncbi:MAG: hypothetical protein F6K26_42285, partial [Moorea sp. SIO2I5]|nr:hypothetical protein [Moorena sp. SIO2I5]
MVQKDRCDLKKIFKTGAKPSQQDFADFIDSTLNIKEDGIEKPGKDTPLKITAQGKDEKLLDFYAGDTKTWSINQKSGDKPGLNISNSSGDSKLFIDSSNGNVGLSIDHQPTAKLHIQQTGNEDALRIDDELKDTIFLINKDGNVGIGTSCPDAKLEIKGNQPVLKIWGQGDNDNATIQLRESTAANWGFDLKYIGNPDNKFYIESYSDCVSKGKHLTIVRESGNVGIGTTCPDAKLEVNGNLKLCYGVAVNAFSCDGTLEGCSDLAIPTEKAIKTYADTKALLNGSPSEDFSAKNLTVNGVIKPSAGNKKNNGILFTKEPDYGSKDAAWIRYYRCGNSGENTTLEIGTSNDCDDHIALMPGKGNVGIGTTNPRAKLSINGGLHVGGDCDPGDKNLLVDGRTTTKELSVSGSLSFDTPTRQIINMCNNNYGIGIQDGTQYFRTDNNFAWYKGGTHDNNELNPGTDGIVQMVIKDCHVGIGTIDPGAKLEVKGNLKLLKGVAVNEF